MTGPDVRVQRAADRFHTRTDQISTRHAFSFGTHYDPGNVGFGTLLAANTETLRPGHGYADHPHADIEIVTWMLDGALVHTDTAGGRDVVHPGLVQRLSAGRGVVHAERADAGRGAAPGAPPVRFLQMWVRPDVAGTPPDYALRPLPEADLATGWVPVASATHPDAVVALGSATSTLWATRVAAGQVRVLPEAALAYVAVTDGSVEVETVGELGAGDDLRVTGRAPLAVTAVRGPAELVVWTMAAP